MPKIRKLRAIDLYSGAGGWSLGLRMAGINVVASYDHWPVANETNQRNNGHPVYEVDIRQLALTELPDNIDLIVGSPPCTEFSFANRGGNGDIKDGLEDIIRFLTIVKHVRPRAWAMENVPRVAHILEKELGPRGRLRPFTDLGITYQIVNMENYGVPQRRRRCIAGSLNFEKLETYKSKGPAPTLGSIVTALAENQIRNPIYGETISKNNISDHIVERLLNEEEVRINRANKLTHPVYNRMPFPDPLNRTVRTVTATCTRVSRESIVIADPVSKGKYRRLTLRERATLQCFPISYQFFGASYGQKQEMIGNAIPPSFAYFVALSMMEGKTGKCPSAKPSAAIRVFKAPTTVPVDTPPHNAGTRFPYNRTFRFAIPSLRLKSGVRFEFANSFEGGNVNWRVDFYFGTSKSIHKLALTTELLEQIKRRLGRSTLALINAEMDALRAYMSDIDVARMQALWSHRGPGATRPFMVLDRLDEAGGKLVDAFSLLEQQMQMLLKSVVSKRYGRDVAELKGMSKLEKNAPLIIAGMIVGCIANASLSRHRVLTTPQRRKAG